MFGFIAISTTYIFGTLLTANKNLKDLNVLALSAVLMNVILNLILIPKFQTIGAAISSLLTQFYMAISQVIISLLRLKLKINPGYVLRLGTFFILVFVIGWASQQYIDNWFQGLGLLIMAAILISFATGLIKIRGIYKLLRFGDE